MVQSMEQIWDCIVIGGGPAGLSAALNLRRRGRTVLVLSGGAPLLEKAELVDNYLGMPGVTGKEMMERFRAHAAAQGAVLKAQRAGNVMPMGGTFLVGAGSDMYTSRAVILACGVSKAGYVPGEAEYLGRGVSYCATCDGMLYRQKRVAVWGLSPEAPEEADRLFCFAAAALARGLSCAGGVFQYAYLPRMAEGTAEALRRCGDDARADRISARCPLGAGFHALRAADSETAAMDHAAGPADILRHGGISGQDWERFGNIRTRDAFSCSLAFQYEDIIPEKERLPGWLEALRHSSSLMLSHQP